LMERMSITREADAAIPINMTSTIPTWCPWLSDLCTTDPERMDLMAAGTCGIPCWACVLCPLVWILCKETWAMYLPPFPHKMNQQCHSSRHALSLEGWLLKIKVKWSWPKCSSMYIIYTTLDKGFWFLFFWCSNCECMAKSDAFK
jgi:hypothetical protein